MTLELNWTTLIMSAITSAINGVAMFLSIRYVSKVVDKIDGGKKKEKKDGNN